jgi:polyhydroxyalkanoate synthesis regulator phasin
MSNHLANLVNRGEITEEEALEILDKYSYADYKDRDWHIEDIGRSPFGVPDVETIFKDQYGNSVSYTDIMDELKASGMSQEEADQWMYDLLIKLHGNKEWGN